MPVHGFPEGRASGRDQVAYHDLGIINSILQLTSEPLSTEELLGRVLDHVLTIESLAPLSRGAVFLIEEDPEVLVLKAFRGLDHNSAAACRTLHVGKSLCGQAVTSRKLQFVECIYEPQAAGAQGKELHGNYYVPLVSGGRALGVMDFHVEVGHKRDPDEEELLLVIANLVAAALERRKAEETLREAEERYRKTIRDLKDEKKFTETIIQNLSGGLIVLDGEGRIMTCNPNGERVLKNFAGEVEGRRLSEILGERAAAIITDVAAHSDHAGNEITLRDMHGEEKIIGFATAPREDLSGETVGYIVCFRDITGIKYMQREMEKMNRLSTVAEIASAVAHEVRNPLAGIKTLAQSIDENLREGDEKKEYMRRIIKQVDRLNRILTEFFTYARPTRPIITRTSLVDIIREVKPLIEKKMEEMGISFREDYGRNLPDILVDPNQMQQVFLNLFLNAIDAVKDRKGVVEIRARLLGGKDKERYVRRFPDLRERDDYVVVFFSDNGSGMSREKARKIFEPFFTTKFAGTGLGLSIVYRILRENGAAIFVDSDEGKGTTFTILLPLHR